jgi:excisionase family DNA binding protein
MKAANKKEAMSRLLHDLAICVDDAALVLGTDRKALYGEVHAGTIPHIKIGRAIRIPTAALLKLLGISGSVSR